MRLQFITFGRNLKRLGLGSYRGNLGDHFRPPQPIDLNLDVLGITHLDHESRVASFTS